MGLGVDFVFPLSQQEQKKNPHQNLSEGGVLEVLNLTYKLQIGCWMGLEGYESKDPFHKK